ncbi:MAG: mercuric reductase [Candidatus Magasanikbacteria bacterium]
MYDSIIIGSGQAGVPLAVSLADEGEEVALVEKNKLGGSCVNYGCTPSKAMISSARRAWVAKNSRNMGVEVENVSVDLEKIVERKDKIVKEFREGVAKRIDKDNIDLFREKGKLLDNNEVKVGSETIEGEKIFINTGQSPFIPPIDGIEEVNFLTSSSIMNLKEAPESLIVIGGGYVGLEFGQAFHRFGSEVTIIERGSQLASHEDEDIASAIKYILEEESLEIYLESEASEIKQKNNQVKLKISKEGKTKKLVADEVLVAAGRSPNTGDIGLENTKVKTTDGGYIETDNRFQTDDKNIWALGDVRLGPAFTHTSYEDYKVVMDNLYGDGEMTRSDRVLVYGMFIDPPLGRAGLSVGQAKSKDLDYEVVEYPMSYVARAIELGEKKGKMKLVVEKESRKILGAAILGYEGAELIQVIAAYMNAGVKVDVVQDAMAIHPTVVEGIQSLAKKF